ncbi:MAG TPA: lactate racemase domain-containing protein [Chloroflexota bacterium]
MVTGGSSTEGILAPERVTRILADGLGSLALDGKRVLVIVPDRTRSAPIPMMFQALWNLLGNRVARLDYLIALGTHPQMGEEDIDTLVGVPAAERADRYPNTRIFNHRWDDPSALTTIGTIPANEMDEITGGLVPGALPVRLNKLALEYDQVLICGPVFPHEVVGFSGGAKYLFPGIAGAEIIEATHWLGALATCMKTIGVKDTPVRRVIHRGAEFLPTPLACIAMVMKGQELRGLYVGPHQEAWSAAADLSLQLNVVTVPRPFRRVLSMPSTIYDDLWTAAKAMYKTESAVADGGEIIIYAPHITEVSYTHGRQIDEIGYHVRDYFVKQPDRFAAVSGTIKAHSTHVKGAGEYDAATGIETPRINVTLATGIPEDRCRRINLGYADYREIDPETWAGRESEGVLLVPHAGEVLFRAEKLS